jgi:hypothetical protein
MSSRLYLFYNLVLTRIAKDLNFEFLLTFSVVSETYITRTSENYVVRHNAGGGGDPVRS